MEAKMLLIDPRDGFRRRQAETGAEKGATNDGKVEMRLSLNMAANPPN